MRRILMLLAMVVATAGDRLRAAGLHMYSALVPRSRSSTFELKETGIKVQWCGNLRQCWRAGGPNPGEYLVRRPSQDTSPAEGGTSAPISRRWTGRCRRTLTIRRALGRLLRRHRLRQHGISEESGVAPSWDDLLQPAFKGQSPSPSVHFEDLVHRAGDAGQMGRDKTFSTGRS
jgi:hypothetical protein